MPTPDDLLVARDAWIADLSKVTDLTSRVAQLTAERDTLAAQLRTSTDEKQALQNQVTALTATIADLESEIERLNDIIDPPAPDPDPVPTTTRKVLPFGPPGGGGMEGILVDSKGGVWMGTDVGQMEHMSPGEWFWHKCNLGLDSARHMASFTEEADGRILAIAGAPGSQEGAFLFDHASHKWTGPLNGSKALQVNSQNSYGEQGGGWPYGIGHRYVRSTGSLAFLRPNGELVGGEFGYAPPGSGVTLVRPDGSSVRVPGTDQWACRDVKPSADRKYAYVSIWKSAVAWSQVQSPGGCYKVDLDAKTFSQVPIGTAEVEKVSISGQTIVAACRNEGIRRSTNGGASFTDISYNLPRNSWWYAVKVDSNGRILVGSCEPKVGGDGKYWCWALLEPGATAWKNLGAVVNNFDAASGVAFVPPNAGNTMGKAGCTIVGVDFRNGQPVAAGGGGVCWTFINGESRPVSYGVGILVNRDFDASADRSLVAMACSDFNVMLSKSKGAEGSWYQLKTGMSGSNDGAAVAFASNGDLHFQNVDGGRFVLPKGASSWQATSGAMPAKQPHGASFSGGKLMLNGKDITTPEIARFGLTSWVYGLDANTVVGGGHGAWISKLVTT